MFKIAVVPTTKEAGLPYLSYLKKYNPKELIKQQRRKGLITLKKHPKQFSEMGKTTYKRHPKQFSEMGKTTYKRHPKQFSEMGKTTQRKHPEVKKGLDVSFFKKKHGKNWRTIKSKPLKPFNTNSKHQRMAGLLAHKKHPTLARRAGLKAGEALAKKGFVSKPEIKLGTILPKDFIHGKQLGRIGVPDYHSPERKMVIQCDGIYWHSKPEAVIRDEIQTKYWKKMGYDTFRFTDEDIMNKFDKVRINIQAIVGGV